MNEGNFFKALHDFCIFSCKCNLFLMKLYISSNCIATNFSMYFTVVFRKFVCFVKLSKCKEIWIIFHVFYHSFVCTYGGNIHVSENFWWILHLWINIFSDNSLYFYNKLYTCLWILWLHLIFIFKNFASVYAWFLCFAWHLFNNCMEIWILFHIILL